MEPRPIWQLWVSPALATVKKIYFNCKFQLNKLVINNLVIYFSSLWKYKYSIFKVIEATLKMLLYTNLVSSSTGGAGPGPWGAAPAPQHY